MAKPPTKPARKKAGRPKIQWTPHQIKKVKEYAFQGCHTRTIATLMGVDEHTITNHFSGVLAKKRAERKSWLRQQQNKAMGEGDRTMLVFLGKNELDQADKKETDVNLNVSFSDIMKVADGS
jgi:DNA-binding NarL/FixJ family response regulator